MKKILRFILVAIVSILLLALLFSQIAIPDLVGVFREIQLSYILLGFFVYAVMNLFRNLRFQALIGREINFWTLFSIVLVHNFYNNILPFRTGELSFFWLMKKKKIKFHKSLSLLMTARIMDLTSILLIFLVTLFFIRNIPTKIILFRNILLLISLLSLFFMAATLTLGKKIIKKSNFKNKYILKIIGALSEVRKEIKNMNTIQFILAFAYSIAIWLISFFFYIIVIKGAGFTLPVTLIIIAATFAIFSTLLPIQGFLQLGTVEGAWAMGLILMGISNEIAIYTGFITHLVRILYFSILGLCGFWWYKNV